MATADAMATGDHCVLRCAGTFLSTYVPQRCDVRRLTLDKAAPSCLLVCYSPLASAFVLPRLIDGHPRPSSSSYNRWTSLTAPIVRLSTESSIGAVQRAVPLGPLTSSHSELRQVAPIYRHKVLFLGPARAPCFSSQFTRWRPWGRNRGDKEKKTRSMKW